MANIVTIDNYTVETHERYATDQNILDRTFIDESNLIPSHFALARGKSTVLSKWEELFETHLHLHPWAAFAPPPMFSMMRNRFFSNVISPEFNWVETDDEEDDEKKQEREETRKIEEFKEKIKSKKSHLIPTALFERDQTALLNLLDSVQTLNGFLREIHARKLQYQKG